jgi:hypothetical protein
VSIESQSSTVGYRELASYRRCRERIAAAWPSFTADVYAEAHAALDQQDGLTDVGCCR